MLVIVLHMMRNNVVSEYKKVYLYLHVLLLLQFSDIITYKATLQVLSEFYTDLLWGPLQEKIL